MHLQVCIKKQTFDGSPTLEETFNFRKTLECVCFLRCHEAWTDTREPAQHGTSATLAPFMLVCSACARACIGLSLRAFMSWEGCARCANTTTPLSTECPARPIVSAPRETLACHRVVYTALVGPYDNFEAFADAHAHRRAPDVCYVAVVDALRKRNYSYWLPIVLPRLFPDDAARSAHALKSLPLQLFPRADWVLYMDSKTTLAMPAPTLVGRWLQSNGQLHVLHHPNIDHPLIS